MISEQQRAREEAEKKVQAMTRRMDHLERARREEEAPLLEQEYAAKVSTRCFSFLLPSASSKQIILEFYHKDCK